MNMHDIVRGAIETVHKDESATLYQSAGRENVKGKLYPVYFEPIEIKANFQPAGAETLSRMEAMNITGDTEEAFLYSDTARPVAGIIRRALRGGDIIEKADGTFWQVTAVNENWSAEGWADVVITIQTTAPDFSRSGWSA